MLKDRNAFSGYSIDDVDGGGSSTPRPSASLTRGPGDRASSSPGDNNVLVYGKGDAHEPASFTVLNFEVDEIEPAVDELTEGGVEFERYEGTDLETNEKGTPRRRPNDRLVQGSGRQRARGDRDRLSPR